MTFEREAIAVSRKSVRLHHVIRYIAPVRFSAVLIYVSVRGQPPKFLSSPLAK